MNFIMQMFRSRLEATCLECGYSANRSEFIHPVEHRAGLTFLDDECPKCYGDDVDVFIPGFSFAALEADFGHKSEA